MFGRSVSKKLEQQLLSNPDYQYAFVVGIIDNLNKNLDKCTDDLFSLGKDVTPYREQLDILAQTVSRNLAKLEV